MTPALYSRRFPFNLRGSNFKNQPDQIRSGARVAATFGLWLKEPDIDATTRLSGRIVAKDFQGSRLCAPDQNTWSPIKSQNTSVVREWTPAFLCIPIGFDVPGGKIQRYGDILGGYFLQALLFGSAANVALGCRLVEHLRNPHNCLDDLRREFCVLMLTDWLLHGLKRGFRPTSSNPADRVREVADFLLTKMILEVRKWTPPQVVDFLRDTAITMQAWAKACETVH